MANERTLLAWLQTSIDIIGLGFVVVSFGLFLCEFGLIMTKESGQIQQEAPIHSPSSMFGLSMVGAWSPLHSLCPLQLQKSA